MSTTRIQNKVSELVNSQLPEFIRTDYTTFVAFLEYYYKFLEQDQGALELVQNARQYNDIDQTADSFVNYFLTNYAKDLPHSLQVNKPLLIKRIKDLYAAKGSTLSIETLFKVLYDTAATTRHPYDFVLRPSDGKWSLRSSIRVLKTYGSTADIKDRFLTFTKNNIKYTVEVVRIKNLSTDLYEVFYKSKVSVPFEIDDEVAVSDSTNVIFTGIIKPTTVSWSITKGGSGFRAGQIFNVAVYGAVDTLVRITKVSSTGSIEALKILNYGYNFTDDVTITLTNSLGVAAQAINFATTSGGFAESFEMVKYVSGSSPDRYFDTDYVLDTTYTGFLLAQSGVESQAGSSVSVVGSKDLSSAVISFKAGAIARYPGEYTSTQGFISEPDIRLQDGKLYQPFAYQVESELDISVFYNIVKKLVHQAGTNMFVNRVISTTANISANVTVGTRKNVFMQFNSTFNALDTTLVALYKNLGTDNVSTTDTVTVALGKYFSDDITPVEDFNIVLYLEAFADSAETVESLSLNIGKFIDDVSNVNVTESFIQNFGKLIDNTDSTVTFTDSGSGVLLNYTDAVGASGYFAETYVGGTVLTF